jgi:hypothetical protein
MYLTALRPTRLSFELAEVIAVRPTPRPGFTGFHCQTAWLSPWVRWLGAAWGPRVVTPHAAPSHLTDPGGA